MELSQSPHRTDPGLPRGFVPLRIPRRLSQRSASGHDHGFVDGISHPLHRLVVGVPSTLCKTCPL